MAAPPAAVPTAAELDGFHIWMDSNCPSRRGAKERAALATMGEATVVNTAITPSAAAVEARPCGYVDARLSGSAAASSAAAAPAPVERAAGVGWAAAADNPQNEV